MLQRPKAFNMFAQQFDDELADEYDTDEEFVAITARIATLIEPTAEGEIRDFLTHLIEGGYSDAELEAFWETTPSMSAFCGEELRQLLPIMHDTVGVPLPKIDPSLRSQASHP